MADLDKFQRSRDMISEIQNRLREHASGNDAITSYIATLEQSINIIDGKIEAYKIKKSAGDQDDMLMPDDHSDAFLAA